MFRVVDEQIVENFAYTNGAYLAQRSASLPPSGSAAERTMTGAFRRDRRPRRSRLAAQQLSAASGRRVGQIHARGRSGRRRCTVREAAR